MLTGTVERLVYVVLGSVGEYSERKVGVVAVFGVERSAKDLIEKLDAHYREHQQMVGRWRREQGIAAVGARRRIMEDNELTDDEREAAWYAWENSFRQKHPFPKSRPFPGAHRWATNVGASDVFDPTFWIEAVPSR